MGCCSQHGINAALERFLSMCGSMHESVRECTSEEHPGRRVDFHQLAVAIALHVLEHVPLVKHGTLERQLLEDGSIVLAAHNVVPASGCLHAGAGAMSE